MPAESRLATKMKEDIAEAIAKVANVSEAIATGDTWVTVATETGTRTLPRAVGAPIVPGDQVLVIDTGSGAVVLCAIAQLGD